MELGDNEKINRILSLEILVLTFQQQIQSVMTGEHA